MINQEIKKLIQKGESETVELKASLSDWKKILEEISALANTKGGILIVGATNKGKVLGVTIGKDTIEDLTNKITTNIDPKIYPEIEVRKIESKKIIIITIKPTQNKPYLAFGKAFKRTGKSTLKMSRDEYERMILEKHRDELRFDNRICKGASLKDIDKEKIRWFLRKAKTERSFDVDPETPTKEALEKLELLTPEGLTNAAILLFGNNPQRFFSQARIRCARFKGTESLDFIDMKVLDGTIPDLRKRAMQFIMQHIKHGVFFDENRRYDKWEYPLRALEEASTNALAHRDYFSNAEIQLSIFDDRIEIWNPGELPESLKPEDLKRKHRSIPRNKLIADCLFLIKYIERWGTGTNRMIKEMKNNGLEEPEFQNLSGGFEVTLMGPGKDFEEQIEKEKLHILKINERQKKAMGYIKKTGKITRREYIEINNVSHKTAHLELSEMVNKHILKRKGKGRSTIYVL